jgi:hypothetical protein
MKHASKKEAQAALTAARLKAQHSSERLNEMALANPTLSMLADYVTGNPEMDAAKLNYQRCVREFEEAINDYDQYDTGDD